ncbi:MULTISPECIES: enolase C-terminal domain-like protein [unclassified Roseitalea]|uniref:phosphopyruvate hydratase n=1 Tax=unclassified Roseitalea TaxID=2639107 RepID=UPI00273DCC1F|nr:MULTISPECIES: enolase C-terminal domain-like protein [unclassified Roseitalea]
MKAIIAHAHARRIWDSRGRPTIEVELTTAAGHVGRAIAPAGASTGSGEAVDLRDGGAAMGGYDVRGAVKGFEHTVAPALSGRDAADQAGIDALLAELDGTADFGRLGGNTAIATSMAAAHLAAAVQGVPLWRYLAGEADPPFLPLPEIQIFGGGAHAAGRLDVQDFMITAIGAPDYRTALDWTAEVYRAAGAIMAETGRLAGVADEGGWWPAFDGNEDAIATLTRAIEQAGLRPGLDMAISLDIAASEFGDRNGYRLAREGRTLSSEDLADLIAGWTERYPIVAVEDPLGETDIDGLAAFTGRVGDRVEVIGDDALVTDAKRIEAAAARRACNAVLIKPNQIGTLTGARAALEAARRHGWGAVVSARSGESEDVTIVHLAVGWGVPQLKVGSFARSERMAKWNEGLRVAESAPCGPALPPRSTFPWG